MASSAPAPWQREPFRVLFPVGVILAWVGVGHWILYWSGLQSSYSCETHGLIQLQAFLPAFAAGFLLTAVPRRTGTAPASRTTIGMVMVGVTLVVGAGLGDRRLAMQAGYLLVWASLLSFAVPRLRGVGAARRPPAGFVLVPIGAMFGCVGAVLLMAHDARPWPFGDVLARLLVEQGVFLCLSIGVGSLFFPLLSGTPPPADLDGGPAERRRLMGFAVAGLTIGGTLVAEAVGFERSATLVRGLVVTAGMAFGIGATKRPGRPGLNRVLVWVGLWLQPIGLLLAAALPDFRVAALHVTFIGGFAMLALGVGSHVVLSHTGGVGLRERTHAGVVAWSAGIVLALFGRIVADWSDTYFEHLASAAAVFILGSAVWLVGVVRALMAERGEQEAGPT